MKKIYFLLIALLCSATMAFAYDAEIDGIYYDFDHENKTATVTNDEDSWGGNGAGYIQSEIVIPEKVTYNGEEYIVTSIGSYAFHYCSSLTSITIPNSVTSIGESAFSYCSSLTSVTIPNSVTSIGRSAFYDTPWFENQPSGCIYISKCLYKCKGEMPENTHIDIKEGTVQICGEAFWNCYWLTSVTIPESIIDIASDAFHNCNLTSVQWNAINYGDFYSYRNAPFVGDLYENFSLKSFTFGENVKHIPAYICYNLKNLNTVSIPKSVETVGTEAFEGTAWLDNQPEGCVYINNSLCDYKNGSLTQIEVREGTTQICTSAFSNANITSITIPNSVTEIGGGVFYNCTALKSIVFSTNMNSLPCYEYSD